jgi:hypothetical protein
MTEAIGSLSLAKRSTYSTSMCWVMLGRLSVEHVPPHSVRGYKVEGLLTLMLLKSVRRTVVVWCLISQCMGFTVVGVVVFFKPPFSVSWSLHFQCSRFVAGNRRCSGLFLFLRLFLRRRTSSHVQLVLGGQIVMGCVLLLRAEGRDKRIRLRCSMALHIGHAQNTNYTTRKSERTPFCPARKAKYLTTCVNDRSNINTYVFRRDSALPVCLNCDCNRLECITTS